MSEAFKNKWVWGGAAMVGLVAFIAEPSLAQEAAEEASETLLDKVDVNGNASLGTNGTLPIGKVLVDGMSVDAGANATTTVGESTTVGVGGRGAYDVTNDDWFKANATTFVSHEAGNFTPHAEYTVYGTPGSEGVIHETSGGVTYCANSICVDVSGYKDYGAYKGAFIEALASGSVDVGDVKAYGKALIGQIVQGGDTTYGFGTFGLTFDKPGVSAEVQVYTDSDKRTDTTFRVIKSF